MQQQTYNVPSRGQYAVIRKFGTPDVIQIEELDVPTIENNQLLVETRAMGLNPIDWKQRKGNHKFILGSPFPIVLGYDVSGVVMQVGSDIQNFKIGDEVFGVLDNKYGGAYGSYVKGKASSFVHKPLTVSFQDSASVSLSGLTVLQAFRDKAGLKRGQTLIVNGAGGGVGHLAVQIGKVFGAYVIAVGSHRSKAFIESLKPDEFVNYTDTDWLKKVKKADVFFDVAGAQSFVKVHPVLKPNGTYINTLPRPKILFNKLLQPFVGGRKVKTLLMKHSAADLETLSEWLANGKLKVHVGKTFQFFQISEAHTFAQSGKVEGKVVVTMPAEHA